MKKYSNVPTNRRNVVPLGRGGAGGRGAGGGTSSACPAPPRSGYRGEYSNVETPMIAATANMKGGGVKTSTGMQAATNAFVIPGVGLIDPVGGATDTKVIPSTPVAPKGGDNIDWRSAVDDAACQQAALGICSPEEFAFLDCARMNQNVPPLMTSLGVNNSTRDFQQGGRTTKRLADLLHHLNSGAPMQGVFQAVDISFAGDGTDWGIAIWTLLRPLLSFGIVIIGSRSVLNNEETTLTLTNDTASLGPRGERFLPPLSDRRDTGLVRGRGGNSLVCETAQAQFAITVPWLYRTSEANNNMDTAQSDMGRAAIITRAKRAVGQPFEWVQSASPAPPSQAPIFCIAFRMQSTASLSTVRAAPIAFNNLTQVNAGFRLLDPGAV